MDSFAHAGGDAADTKLLATSAAPPVSANKLLKGFGYTDEHNKIGRDWLPLEVTQDDGPSREAGAEESMQPRGRRQDRDNTVLIPEEKHMLSTLGPKRRSRRRCAHPRGYDALVELAEQTAQRRHDALYGPSSGAGTDSDPASISEARSVQPTRAVDSALDLHAMD